MWIDRIIRWMVERNPQPQRMMNSDSSLHLADRYRPFWEDEFSRSGRTYFRPPWWRPFNVLLHNWRRGEEAFFHDHPRWSITICLKGRLIEHSFWRSRELRPGSIVFRSRKSIHRFDKPDNSETWTLFIVGRRNYPQARYNVVTFDDLATETDNG